MPAIRGSWEEVSNPLGQGEVKERPTVVRVHSRTSHHGYRVSPSGHIVQFPAFGQIVDCALDLCSELACHISINIYTMTPANDCPSRPKTVARSL